MPSSGALAIAASDSIVNTAFAFITFLLYTGAGFGLLRRMVGGPDAAPGRRISLGLGTAGAACHIGLLLYEAWLGPGLSLGFFGAASVITALMSALLLLISLRRPLESLGALILPFTGVIVLLDALFAGPTVNAEGLAPGLIVHIVSSVIAYSMLALAAFHSMLLALQEYRLHHRQPGGFVRLLPPLRAMEQILFQMLLLGFAMLSLSLFTGFVFLEDMFAQHLVHKTLLSIAAWIGFGVLLLGRWRLGWRGKTAVRWTLGGFLLLMLAYFGSKFVLELLLHYG